MLQGVKEKRRENCAHKIHTDEDLRRKLVNTHMHLGTYTSQGTRDLTDCHVKIHTYSQEKLIN